MKHFLLRCVFLTCAFSSAAALAQPVNDSCVNVVPDTLLIGTGILFTGDNTGATATGDAMPGTSMDDAFAKVWHAFTLTDCASIAIDYCGNTPVYNIVYSALITTCPADDPVVLPDAQNSTQCGDGNLTMYYLTLPAGTYYIPVFSALDLIGPYQVQVSASPCSGGPPNDECAGAYPVAVNTPEDCPANSSFGDNGSATQGAIAPTCLSGLPFVDVWYRFQSAADTLLVLHIEPIGASSIGVEVFEGCAGAVVHCDYGGVLDDTIAVAAFTDYFLRVFTETDQGVAGTFGFCLNTLPPPIVCDGGSVTTTTALSVVSVCKDGLPDPLGFTTSSTSSENYAYLLCNDGDTVLAGLSGGLLDADTLALGIYHIHGISFNGGLSLPVIGVPVDSIAASGACLDVGDDFVTLSVEICSGLAEIGGSPITIFPHPSNGEFTIGHDLPGTLLEVNVMDMTGRTVVKGLHTSFHGRCQMTMQGRIPPGSYVLLISSNDQVRMTRLMIR